MSLKHVVVGGGTGFIGSHLVKRLTSNGYQCTIVSRMPGPNRISWHDVEYNGLPEDTFAVINVAGQNVLDLRQHWTPGFKHNVFNSRVQTTRLLASAVQEINADTFVTISGVSYYKPNDDVSYTEDSSCEPYDFLSVLCHQWEDAAVLPKDCSTRQVTIRSGVVLGRDGGMIKTVQPLFAMNLGSYLGSGKQYMPWIHIKDLTNIFMQSIQNKNMRGIINGVAPQVITNKEFTKAYAKAMGVFAFLWSPTFVLNMIYHVERATLILEGQKVIPKRLNDIGYEFDYPNIRQACKELTEKDEPSK